MLARHQMIRYTTNNFSESFITYLSGARDNNNHAAVEGGLQTEEDKKNHAALEIGC